MAATIYAALAIAALTPWLRLGKILARPNPSWAGIAIGIILSSGLAIFFARKAWLLHTADPEPVAAPEGERKRWHSPTTYFGAALFAAIGIAMPVDGMRWDEGLVFLLLSVACLGEGYRIRRALAAPAPHS
jgi:hypothetical protein